MMDGEESSRETLRSRSMSMSRGGGGGGGDGGDGGDGGGGSVGAG
jgi:hypothetical protein